MIEIQDTGKIYIFGAGSRAKTLKGYFQYLYPEVKILSFLVDNMEENEAEVDKIPVLEMDKVKSLDSEIPVYIATKGVYHTKIIAQLEQKGVQRIIPVTVEIDNYLRNEYVKKYYEKEHLPFVKLSELLTKDKIVDRKAVIYVAKSIYDKELKEKYEAPLYEKAIQVGAALTEERLEEDILTDCEGDNISHKNRQYCELTALYWIWKHAEEDIIGLAHYRRHFILPDQWLEIMIENDVDVILPVPTFVAPSVGENYMERHDPTDWECLLEYLREKYPKDYEKASIVFSGNLYFPCNMFIMKRKILYELCTWMFPVLDAIVEQGGSKPNTYLNRYPGFLSERLITLFFYLHRNEYRIVYADKNFLF